MCVCVWVGGGAHTRMGRAQIVSFKCPPLLSSARLVSSSLLTPFPKAHTRHAHMTHPRLHPHPHATHATPTAPHPPRAPRPPQARAIAVRLGLQPPVMEQPEYNLFERHKV